MDDENPDVKIPTTEAAVIEMLEAREGEVTEQEKNLAITQARLIGDIE